TPQSRDGRRGFPDYTAEAGRAQRWDGTDEEVLRITPQRRDGTQRWDGTGRNPGGFLTGGNGVNRELSFLVNRRQLSVTPVDFCRTRGSDNSCFLTEGNEANEEVCFLLNKGAVGKDHSSSFPSLPSVTNPGGSLTGR